MARTFVWISCSRPVARGRLACFLSATITADLLLAGLVAASAGYLAILLFSR